MDYYQGIVSDYLAADPAVFVKPECCIRLNPRGRAKKGEHWYCDVVAVDLREHRVYLCEVTYSQTLATLLGRLRSWAANWSGLRVALVRDNHVPEDWDVRPWVFVPQAQLDLARDRIAQLRAGDDAAELPEPLLTTLEEVVPWLHRSPHGFPKRSGSLPNANESRGDS